MNHLQKEPFFISIVIPIMNESGNIEVLLDRISASLQDLERYEIIFVDDGSTDETLSLLKQYHSHNKRIQYLSFSRNFGHQNALKAGLHFANGDCVISLDGDLQHPPELIPELIDKWLSGYDVVYTIRKEDMHLSFLKRKTSHFFYKLMNIVSDVQLEEGSADYRLMDKYVVEVIKKLDEDSLFFRGITKWIGFKQCSIEYTPAQRTWGESKYPFKKMVRFAVQGITSFSIQPLF